VRGDEGADLCPAVFELAKRTDWPVRELRNEVRTLESVFNDLARDAGPADAPPADVPPHAAEAPGARA
jgi:hypothetical protein